MNKTSSLWFALLIVIAASLACNFGLAGAKPPPVPVSTEAIQDLQEEVSTAVEQLASTG